MFGFSLLEMNLKGCAGFTYKLWLIKVATINDYWREFNLEVQRLRPRPPMAFYSRGTSSVGC